MMVLLWSLLFVGTALTLPTNTSSNIYNAKRIFARDGPSIQASDPWDRRWIEQLTAVGDSYSIGLGAGHAVKGTRQVTKSDVLTRDLVLINVSLDRA